MLRYLKKSRNYCTLGNGKEKVKIQQLLNSPNLNIFKGDKESPRAIISEGFGKLKNNSQLEYSLKSKSNKFLTLISMGENDRVKDISLSENILSIDIDNKSLNIVL